MKLNWVPIFPVEWIVICGVTAFILLSWGLWTLKKRGVSMQWMGILGAMRVLIVVLFLLCLLRPVLSWISHIEQGPDILVMMDHSRSMMTIDAPNGVTRYHNIASWLKDGRLSKQMEEASWFRFDQHAYQSSLDNLLDPGKSDQPAAYAKSLKEAFEQYRYEKEADHSPVRVLLASDGNDKGQEDFVETALNLGFAVDVLPPETIKSAEGDSGSAHFVSIQSPRRVLIGSESRFLVTLRHQGLANQPLTLRLTQDGREIATQQVQFTPNESEQKVNLVYRPSEIGFREYQMELSGFTGKHPTQVMTVEVVGTRNDVLMLEDAWRWEFKYLRRALEDDPSFSFTGFLNRRGRVYVAFADSDRTTQLTTFPRTETDLNGFDIFILGDVDPRQWSSAFLEGLRDMIVNKGKSLIIVAGPRIGLLATSPELSSLLPVVLDAGSSSPIPGPIQIQVSPAARDFPFFQNSQGNAWGDLPPLDRIYAPLRKKPAANILLQTTQLGNDFGPLIVAAAHTVGRGKVLFLGADTFWKWQMSGVDIQPGVTPYALFWQQTFRALAPKFSNTDNQNIVLESEKTAYQVGDKVVLRAQLIRSDKEASPRGKMRGSVKFPDGQEIDLGFSVDSSLPLNYVTEIAASQSGAYTFVAEWLEEGRVVASTQAVIDVASDQDDEILPVNMASLIQIAEATGGRVIDRTNPATWPIPQNLEKMPVQRPHSIDLWDSGILLALLVLVMGLDWWFRLKKGFV